MPQGEAESCLEGVRQTVDLFEKVLRNYDSEIINPCPKETFDPKKQDAIEHKNDNGRRKNIVIDVLCPGFLFNGSVVQAAAVKTEGPGPK